MTRVVVRLLVAIGPVLFSFVCVTPSLAVNHITVESRVFAPGQAVCSVGVFITNDDPMTCLIMPIEFRTASGGAYMQTTFTLGPRNRLASSPLSALYSPAAGVTTRKYNIPSNTCSGPISQSWSASVVQIGFTSPDAILWASVSTGDRGIGDSVTFDPGSDPNGTAFASFLFTFGVSENIGTFEIDTACVAPSNHLSFIDGSQTGEFHPLSFTKGLISICDVSLAGDCDFDGIDNLSDNCPERANSSQDDGDNDGFGDACDNCAVQSNPAQADADHDLAGDLCDNCLEVVNPSQDDSDSDGSGDACDNCPSDYNPAQLDTDGDEIGDLCDNCPGFFNDTQADADGDGLGNACDPCPTDTLDACPCDCSCHADPDCNGSVNVVDVVHVANRAYRGSGITADFSCHGHFLDVDGRTDVDCNGVTNLLDHVKMVNVAFRGDPPSMWFCNPCAP